MTEKLKRGDEKYEYIIPEDLRDTEAFKGSSILLCLNDDVARENFEYARRKYLCNQNEPAEEVK